MSSGSSIFVNIEPEKQGQPFGVDTQTSPCKQTRLSPREDSMIELRSGAIRGLCRSDGFVSNPRTH